MREYISKQLDTMTDLREKNQLRTVLENVFLPLYDATLEKYQALEDRVRDELPATWGEHTVYSTLLPKKNATGYVPWLFPIADISTDNSSASGRKFDKGSVIDTVFIESDYLICKELLSGKEIFNGTIFIEEQEYPVQVSLKPSKKYFAAILSIYPHFINNGIPWTTLNIPYIHKMFDIILLTELSHLESEDEEKNNLFKWEISFGKCDEYIEKDLVPVWNVSQFTVKNMDFPIPIIDKREYESEIDLKDEGLENGFLADYNSAPISNTRRETDKYIVTISEKKNFECTLYKFSKPVMTGTNSFRFPLFSNKQQDQFAGRMVNYYGSKVNTRAELARVINSFEIHDFIKFENSKVLNNRVITGETYESNFFLKDEIRDDNISKTLMLEFSKNSNKNIYLMRDVMSFVVSQVQFIYPEYNCVGALL